MHRLYCSPLGNSKLDDFLDGLSNPGAGEITRNTVLVLPSPFLLDYARSALRNRACRVQTMPTVMSMDQLAASLSNLRRISRTEQELLVEQLVLATVGESHEGFFAKISKMPGFVKTLTRLFDELKMAAVTPDELEQALAGITDDSEEIRDRDAILLELFDRYQHSIGGLQGADIAEDYYAAVEKLRDPDGILPFAKVLMAEFSALSPMQLEFIDGLKRKVAIDIALCYEKDRPGVFAAVVPTVQALQGLGFTIYPTKQTAANEPSLEYLRRNLFSETKKQHPVVSGIETLVSASRYLETVQVADRVKRWLVAGSRSPADVLLVLRQPEDYPLLRTVFDERGIPLDYPQEQPLLVQTVCRVLLAWLDWVENPAGRDNAFEVLKSPYIRRKLGWDPCQLEYRLLPFVIRNRRDWDTAFEQLVARDEQFRQIQKDWAELQNKLEEWHAVQSMQDCIDAARNWLQWLDLPEILRLCREEGVVTLTEVRGEFTAAQQIFSTLEEIETIYSWAELSESTSVVRQFTLLLKRMWSECRVVTQDRCEGGVRVVRPGAGSGIRFPLTVVMGLAEGRFPAQFRESWLVSYSERQRLSELGVFLSTQEERETMERFTFAQSISIADETLILSANTEAESMISPFVEEVHRLFAGLSAGEPFVSLQSVWNDPQQMTGEPGLCQATVRNLWQDCRQQHEWLPVLAYLQKKLPEGIVDRIQVERDRRGEYAGETGVAWATTTDGRVCFSASALERYAACPFAYFVSDVLGLQAWEVAQEGIDALTAGALWHEILAEFFRQQQQKQLTEPAGQYVGQLMNLLDRAISKRIKTGQLHPGPWWPYERNRWQQQAEAWLADERNRQKASMHRARYFEWAFGMSRQPDSDSDSVEFPLLLDEMTPVISLQGKVDRIDLDPESYRIIDYKTGSIPTAKSVLAGLCLQLPVYMMAAEALLFDGTKTGEGCYLLVGKKGKKLELPGKRLEREELFTLVKQNICQSVAKIRQGSFPVLPAQRCPDYCVAALYCRLANDASAEEPEENTDE